MGAEKRRRLKQPPFLPSLWGEGRGREEEPPFLGSRADMDQHPCRLCLCRAGLAGGEEQSPERTRRAGLSSSFPQAGAEVFLSLYPRRPLYQPRDQMGFDM